MPELIVSNTSPLFYLHRLGLLDVLNRLYGDITVPEAVVVELDQGRSQGEDVPQLDEHLRERNTELARFPGITNTMSRQFDIMNSNLQAN